MDRMTEGVWVKIHQNSWREVLWLEGQFSGIHYGGYLHAHPFVWDRLSQFTGNIYK